MLKKAVLTAYHAMIQAAQGLVKTQDHDVPDDEETILNEFRQRFCDTQIFYDKFQGSNFADYLLRARERLDLQNLSREFALRRLQEAQLFIDAAHSCYNKLQAQNVASRIPTHSAAAASPA